VVDGLLGPGRDVVGENQVAQADICVLTKDDLADELDIDQIRERTQALNPVCRLYLKARDGLPSTRDLETIHDKAADTPPDGHVTGHQHHSHSSLHESVHGSVASWSIETQQPLDWSRVRLWLDHIYSLHAARMLRMKGILAVDATKGQSLLVQAVGPVVSPAKWIDVSTLDPATSRLVLIFRDLDAKALAESFVAITDHDPAKER
jgi:G3E family GTPase